MMIRILSGRFLLISVAGLMGAAACTTSAPKEEGSYTFTHPYNDSVYEKAIDSSTESVKSYDGLTEQFQFDATLMNTAVSEAQLWRNATDFEWPRDKFVNERKSVDENSARETQVFLSFHTPVQEVDNLNTERSLWKIFLDTHGKRYEASVNKASGTLAERQRLFAYHTRFNTGYILTFKVPIVDVQQKEARLILTGPVGSAEVKFEPLSQESK